MQFKQFFAVNDWVAMHHLLYKETEWAYFCQTFI